MSPLLKLLMNVVVGNPASAYTVLDSDPYSVVELPPKCRSVPGMKFPPSCHVHPLRKSIAVV
jgi:hypothetical protein